MDLYKKLSYNSISIFYTKEGIFENICVKPETLRNVKKIHFCICNKQGNRGMINGDSYETDSEKNK